MCCIGNDQVNKIFEASLEPSKKLSPKSERDQREKFIRAKYEVRNYVKPESKMIPVKEISDAISMGNVCRMLFLLACKLDLETVLDQNMTALLAAVRKGNFFC